MSGLKRTRVPHLYRINYPQHGQVGYVVKLNRKRARIHEIFNFSRFPTQNACRQAAEKFALDVEGRFPRLTRKDLARRKTPSGGMLGVRRVVKRVRKRRYEFWEAAWNPKPNEVRKKLFSVRKYGEEEARKLALKTRKAGISAMLE